MLDYRNHIKTILNQTSGDDKSLKNSLNAIKLVLQMSENGQEDELEEASNSKPASPKKDKDIQKFILNLADFIGDPENSKIKKRAISALHKILFNQEIGQNYGKELGKLDQAIKTAKTSDALIQAKVFKRALEPKSAHKTTKPGQFTVIRLTKGADLIDKNGQITYSVSERQIHDLDLKSGDQVAVKVDSKLDSVQIKSVIGYKKLKKREYREISEFKFALVEGTHDHLYIEKNIDNKKLSLGKMPIAAYNQAGLHLEAGSIVDLAWYQDDPLLKSDPSRAVSMRWVYETDQPRKNYKTKKKVTSGTSNLELSDLALNLKNRKVGIAIGDKQNAAILNRIVEHYHGQSIMIDAFNGKKKQIENRVKKLDLLILMTAYASHSATWNLQEFATKYQVKFAVSSSKGYQAFERALYRAAKGLPAYEGTSPINYQTKN